jgi:EmrB/QacA subfamily drug resistance transporter
MIVFVDGSILNVAIPTLIRTLGATPSQVQWIVVTYTLVFAGLLLTSGKLGDRFGRKGVMNAGLVVFGGGSVAAAVATSATQLIAARVVLGIGGALIVPATLSILVSVFTDAHERRRAIAYWSLMNAAGLFFGPVMGGLLLRHFWWGACFIVNLPVVIVALLLGRFFVPTSRDPSEARFDVPAAVISSAALGGLLWAIIEGPVLGWSDPMIVGAFALAVTLGTVFVVWELRITGPMLDVSAFRNPQLSAAAAAITIAFVCMVSSMFLISQSLQLVKGYTPLASALATSVPIVAMNVLVVPRAPGLIERFGTRWLLTAAFGLITCATLIISATTVDSGYASLFVGFALMALAFSVCAPASTEAIMAALPPEKSGGASAINQMTRQLGSALGVAVGGTIAASGYRSSFAASQLGLPPDSVNAARSSITGALRAASSLVGRARESLLDVAHESFLHGVRLALFAAAALAIGGAVFSALAIPSRRQGFQLEGRPAEDVLTD